jgi:RHS repeat-associated protein
VDGDTTEFVWAGGTMIAEKQGTTIRRYFYDGLTPILMEEGGQTYQFQTDHLATPRQMTDTLGNVVWTARLDAYGKVTTETGTVVNNLRFPGQYHDRETGLYYNWHRYYSPELGRYITSDPIGLAGGLNTYAYVGGNPVGAVDPMGLDTIRVTINGTVTVKTGISNPDIRNIFQQAPSNSISYVEITGHGNSGGIDVSKDQFIYRSDDKGVVYSDDGTSFAASLKGKIIENGTVFFAGCNTAREWSSDDNNVAKQLSRELNNVFVGGYRGFGLSNEVSNPFNRDTILFRVGTDMSSIGIPRTYLNGVAQ